MSGRIKITIASILITALFASCATKPDVQETLEISEMTEVMSAVTVTEPTDTEPPTPTPKKVPQFPEFNADYDSREPGMGYRVRNLTFYRDGNPIKARITYPECEGPYKTIIISSGLYSAYGRYSSMVQRFASHGYAVIEFLFQNGVAPEPYHDPKYLGDFIYEQVLDLYAVLDGTYLVPDVDPENIYLFGHSMGGLVTSYVGTMRQTEIKGIILLDPSFYAVKIMKFENEKTIRTDIYSLISRCYVPVVIISGTKAFASNPKKTADQAICSLPYSEYYIIEGATHTFNGDYAYQAVDIAVESLKRWEEEGR